MLRRLHADPSKLMNIEEGVLRGLSLRPPRKVDRPTYEIVSPVERYDMRDYTYSRIVLKEGTPEYKDYYALHPDQEPVDQDLKRRADRSGREVLKKDPVNEQLALAGFYGTMAVSPPKVVDSFKKMLLQPPGRQETVRLSLDPKKITRKIKAFALHLGAVKVAVTRLDQNWVYTHTNAPYGAPVDLNYKNIICMAFAQDPVMTDTQTGFAANFEIGWTYSYASFISIIIANFIRNLGWPARPLPTFNAPYIVAPVFVDAGIGEYGRCGYVVTKEIGNNWRPGAVATDLPLTYDKPVDFGLQAFCEACGICAERCPSGAIPQGKNKRVVVRGIRRWHVDADQCYKYWMTTGHACGVCQAVCPWNHRNALFHNAMRELMEQYPSLTKVALAGEKLFYRYRATPEPKWIGESV